ncbi:MAG: hypothetical protein BWY82_01660 [Verrucomicrobia bacterium ADurb.Bin474]|nr:MAG: hypothetical protein BWY82_01660 [Verrucomicrobia bacterium ADurb.Bin474]
MIVEQDKVLAIHIQPNLQNVACLIQRMLQNLLRRKSAQHHALVRQLLLLPHRIRLGLDHMVSPYPLFLQSLEQEKLSRHIPDLLRRISAQHLIKRSLAGPFQHTEHILPPRRTVIPLQLLQSQNVRPFSIPYFRDHLGMRLDLGEQPPGMIGEAGVFFRLGILFIDRNSVQVEKVLHVVDHHGELTHAPNARKSSKQERQPHAKFTQHSPTNSCGALA